MKSHTPDGERVAHFQTTRVRKGGQLIDVSLTISPIHGRDGSIIGASHIARDITESKQTHQHFPSVSASTDAFVTAGLQVWRPGLETTTA